MLLEVVWEAYMSRGGQLEDVRDSFHPLAPEKRLNFKLFDV